MKFYQSINGYYYKQLRNGEKVRISKEEYQKKNAKKVKKGGGLTKTETLKILNKLDECSIYNISNIYIGVDETNYKFIEVPQGHIYEYDGEHVIDLGTNKVIENGNNIILYIMGMTPCRGLIVFETERILMGHLDSINDRSPLTLQTIDKSLSGDKNKINTIYYVMGMSSFDSMLKEECPLCDISTEIIKLVVEKNLENYTCVVKDFAYKMFTSKFGYNWRDDEFITFPIRPAIKNRFITENEKKLEDYENIKYKEQEKEIECEYIKNKLIRNKKNSKQYQESKTKCLSCNFRIKSRGKGIFLCAE